MNINWFRHRQWFLKWPLKIITVPGHELFKRLVTGLVLLTILVFVFWYAHYTLIAWVLGAITIFIIIKEWPRFKAPYLTIFYPLVPLLLLIGLTQVAPRFLTSLMGITVCSYDSGAYFVGKLCGRTKLCPSISPGKTWEGVLGGMVTAFTITYFVLWVAHKVLPVANTMLFVFLISFAALLGDLFESYLKRRAGIKDAGGFLPGHGGWLDRLDSILVAGILVFFFQSWFCTLIKL